MTRATQQNRPQKTYVRRLAWMLLLLSALLLGGCGDDDESTATSDVGANNNADTNTNNTAEDTAGDTNTTEDTFDVPDEISDVCGAIAVDGIAGDVTDEAGQPLEGVRPQACVRLEGGTLICLTPGKSNADGSFDQGFPKESDCIEELTMRVVLPGSTKAINYCRGDLNALTDGTLVFDETFILFDTDPAEDIPAEGDPDSVRPVLFVGGVTLQVTPSDVSFTGSTGYDGMRLSPVPADADGLCIYGDNPPDALFAMWPEGDIASGAEVPLSLPNTDGLAPGAKVTLYVLGGLICHDLAGEVIDEGDWHPFGEGTVNADGTLIESDAGAGLPCFNWFGYKAN